MGSLAMAVPCLPGGAEKLRELGRECSGPRREEFADFHRRVGLRGEEWFLQGTPEGTMLVMRLEGDPLGALEKLAASDHPFDVWFRDRCREVHGIDLTQPLPGPPPEQVFRAG
jgi:hypothetical protein